MSRKLGILLGLTLAVMVFAGAASATVWDYAADFNSAANPNGAWTYGMNAWWGTPAGWSVYDVNNAWTVGALENWCNGAHGGNAGFGGAATRNGSSSAYEANGGYWEAGQAGLWGAWNGTDAIVRWTAASAMTIDVYAKFTGQNTAGTVEVAQVAKNGASLWTGNIDGFVGRAVNTFSDASGASPVQVYSSTVTVAQGDYIDFMLTQGRYAGDQVGLQLTITGPDVPEPGTLSVLAVFAAGTGLSILRRRR